MSHDPSKIPPLEIINYTLDPGGDIVCHLLEKYFSADEREKSAAVFELRHRIANEIERLMSILDSLEVDPDLEASTISTWGNPRAVDCECDNDEEEPNLGSVGAINQSGWSQGDSNRYTLDRELDLSERQKFYR